MTFSRRRFLGGCLLAPAATSVAVAYGEEATPKELFKILSLDGGGVRGYLSAGILANLEAYLDKMTGHAIPLGQRFDLIVGTSAGGITALGLAMWRRATEIENFYENLIPKIFADSEKRWFRYRNSEYTDTKLAETLKGFFADATLGDVKTDVCITAVALDTGTARFHKSDYRNAAERLDETLVDIALATSAAPTYFPAHNMKHSQHLIDGGVCANNPSMVALAEPAQFQRKSKRGIEPAKKPLTDVVLLSVGTGYQSNMPYNGNDLADAGLVDWALHISDVMFQSQSQLAHQQAKFFSDLCTYGSIRNLPFQWSLTIHRDI